MPLKRCTTITRVCYLLDEKGKAWFRIERSEEGTVSFYMEGEEDPMLVIESEEDAVDLRDAINYVVGEPAQPEED